MNKLRIAVIGAGRWGKNHVKTLSKMGCLAAVIDGNAQTLADIQLQYPQIQTHGSLDDRDALGYDAYVVAVPAEHHFKVAATCIKAKKHVLVEKPLTLSSADSDQLVQLAKDNGVQVLVGHLLLFHPAFLKMKSLIDQGKIGNLQYIYSNRLNLGTVRKEENSLWSFAPHDIALFQYFIGQDPLRVDCQGGAFLQSHIHDTTVTSIRYPNNVCGHIFVSWLHPFKEHRFVMIGSKGMISYEDSSPEKELVFYEKGIDWVAGEPIKRDGPAERIVYNQAAPLEAELQHFIAVIEGRSQNQLISGEAGAAVLRILEMAEEKLHAKQTEMAITEPKTPIQRDYFVHQTAVVDDPVKIGKGTKIWHFSHVQSNAQIGENTILGQNVNVASHVKIGSRVKIQNNVSVYEGVELEDYVFCGPSMVFTNIRNPRCKYPQASSECYIKTLVKEGASLGANSTIVCGVTIGKFAFVAAGAVVTKDVPDYALVLGNPAKVVGWFSEAGFRLDFDQSGEAFCEKSQRRYQLKEGLVYDITESKPLEKESRYVNH